MGNLKHYKIKLYWTIWAFGWHRIKDFQKKTSELRVFFGPIVLTLWR